MDFGRIKYLIEKRNISARSLCEKIGMSEAGFYKMLRLETIKVKTLEQIAELLNVNPQYFFDNNPGSLEKYENGVILEGGHSVEMLKKMNDDLLKENSQLKDKIIKLLEKK